MPCNNCTTSPPTATPARFFLYYPDRSESTMTAVGTCFQHNFDLIHLLTIQLYCEWFPSPPYLFFMTLAMSRLQELDSCIQDPETTAGRHVANTCGHTRYILDILPAADIPDTTWLQDQDKTSLRIERTERGSKSLITKMSEFCMFPRRQAVS